MRVPISVVPFVVVFVADVAWGNAFEAARRSLTAPDSYSMVVMLAVEPLTPTVTRPSLTRDAAIADSTSLVMLMTSVLAVVCFSNQVKNIGAG
ncbi:MAG: hypothetical protein FWD57_08980 [Polyangiaceae bacterium]|nr:hypothetical protein [Polyangiaceae bacterium]